MGASPFARCARARDVDDDGNTSRARRRSSSRRARPRARDVGRGKRARVDGRAAAGLVRRLARAMTRARRVASLLGVAEGPVVKALGFALGWALVYAPSRACACAAGAYVGGLVAAGACAAGAAWAVARASSRTAEHATVGLALSVLPALLTATRELSPWRRGARSTVDGARTGAMPNEAGEADAISLVDVAVGDFRYDLMGEFHGTLPLEDDEYVFKAGVAAAGTFCAVPVTHANWTTTAPVPMWYVCDNSWAGHRNCTRAYEGHYDEKTGWYGVRSLRKCLRAPVEALEAGATELHFLHLDFQPRFERKHDVSVRALMRASVQHEVVIDLAAPRVGWNPIQEPCCAALAKKGGGLVLGSVIVFVVPLALLMWRDVARAARARDRESARGFYTRAELMRASRSRRLE